MFVASESIHVLVFVTRVAINSLLQRNEDKDSKLEHVIKGGTGCSNKKSSNYVTN